MKTNLWVCQRELSCFIALSCICAVLMLTTGCESGPNGNGFAKTGNPFSGMKNPFSSKAADKGSSPEPAMTAQNTEGESEAASGEKKAEADANFWSRLGDGRAAKEAGRYEEAREIYQKLLVQYPTRPEPYHELGVVADRQKRHREAEALYAQAIRRNPADPQVFNDLGYCYFLQGKLEKAESALLKAVAGSPANSKFRNNLGMVYGHQGRLEEALEAFRHAGSESDAQYNLAFVMASQADFDSAKARLQLALAADPTYDPARRALRSFEEYERNPSRVSEPIVNDGTHWTPAVAAGEGSQSVADSGQVMAAAHQSAVSSPAGGEAQPGAPAAASNVTKRQETQSLLRRARAMMQQRMSPGQNTQP